MKKYEGIDSLADALGSADGTAAIARVMRKHYPRDHAFDSLALASLEDPGGFSIAMAALEEASPARARQLRADLKSRGKDLRRASVGLSVVPDGADCALETPDDYPDLTIPDGYVVDGSGVYREVTAADGQIQRTRVTYAPILITARYTDIDTDEEQCRLSWMRGPVWRSQIVPRSIVASARSLVDLAAVGAPVNDTTARATVGYLAAQEHANMRVLPEGRTVSHMGWTGGGRVFVAGDRTYEEPDSDSGITFLARDGAAQMGEGYATAGTWDGWLDALALITDKPLAYVAVYVALAAPFLAVIEACPNFIVDWSARSGRGKTTSLRVGASCYGSPEDGGNLIRSWNSSPTWIERAATTGCDLPLFLDETNKIPAHLRSGLAQTVYTLANGVGKGRGTIKGTQRLTTWRTVVLSTGESRLTDYTQDEGTRGRVISLTGYPLGKHGAELAEALTAALRDNHGHAGPKVIEYLILNRHKWPAIRAKYQAEKERLAADVPNVIARRLAQYVALLSVVASMVHDPNGLAVPRPVVDPIAAMWETVKSTTSDADRAGDALRYVFEACSANQSAFRDRAPEDNSGPRQPSGGWYGEWIRHHWTSVSMFRSRLEKILADGGHVPGSILSEWQSRKWLDAEKNASGRGMTRRVMFGDERVRMICIRRSAFETIGVIEKIEDRG